MCRDIPPFGPRTATYALRANFEVRRTRTFSLSRNCGQTHPPSSFFGRITETLSSLRDSSIWVPNGQIGRSGRLAVRRTRTFLMSRNCVQTHPRSSFFTRITEAFSMLRHSALWVPNGHARPSGLLEVRRTRTFSLSRNCVQAHPPS